MGQKEFNRRTFIKGSVLMMAALGEFNMNLVNAFASPELLPVPYSSGTEYPCFKVPAKAADCHHHIYNSNFPVDPKSTLRHPDASVADYRLLQKRLGTSRNVVVQPSTYGVDNRGLVDALQTFGLENTRGIAVVNTEVTDAELEQLDKAGVRGIRFNMSVPGDAAGMDMVETLSNRVHELGWHIQVVAKPDTIAAGQSLWENIPCPVVFDHLGHITHMEHPAFQLILNLAKEGKAWVKLSGAYILSKTGAPAYADRTAVASTFVEEIPDRLVWGSDWPHPTAKLNGKPDDAVLMNLLAVWAPDETVRNRILVENPEKLYGF